MLESRLIDTTAIPPQVLASQPASESGFVFMHPSCIDTNRLSLFVFAGINTMKRTSSKPYGRMAMRESTARRGFNRGASEGWRARNNRKLPRLAVRPQ